MNLDVIIPVYNEKKTIEIVVNKVLQYKELNTKIIIVDDGSTDGTLDIINDLKKNHPNNIKVLSHDKNLGKGAAIRTAFRNLESQIVLIQDADLEYDPSDYPKLLDPIINNEADVVYGSRFLGGQKVRVHLFWNYLANKLLTLTTNILVNMNFSDMETGYKVFKREVIESIEIEENSFTFEPEITIKLSKKKYIFYEVPISYHGRSYQEGKKIKLIDAFLALYCLFKYRFF
jgi:glycosyltransferase involved in cell wall biosynthesis